MTTNFTIYQLNQGDNIESIAIIKHRKMAVKITNTLLEEGLDVWYEPNSFERDYKQMIYGFPHKATYTWESSKWALQK